MLIYKIKSYKNNICGIFKYMQILPMGKEQPNIASKYDEVYGE